jgi:hypothetical protein
MQPILFCCAHYTANLYISITGIDLRCVLLDGSLAPRETSQSSREQVITQSVCTVVRDAQEISGLLSLPISLLEERHWRRI